MGIKAKELSALAVGKLKQSGMHAVGGEPGLYLTISLTGSRSWIVRVTVDGKRREMGLGSYPAVTLADARGKAREARLSGRSGLDPVADRKRAKTDRKTQRALQQTFAECVSVFMQKHGPTLRNAKHRAQWPSTLETYAYPVIGDLPVAEVSQSHVLQILQPIWTTKTETAARVRGRIEAVLDWATVSGFRTGENPARWKGHLNHLLPAPRRIAKVEHHKALAIDEAPAFMRLLRDRPGVSARALEFLILTSVRSGEVRGASWTEIDLERAVWTIPAERMKAGREHRVPLSEPALKEVAPEIWTLR